MSIDHWCAILGVLCLHWISICLYPCFFICFLLNNEHVFNRGQGTSHRGEGQESWRSNAPFWAVSLTEKESFQTQTCALKMLPWELMISVSWDILWTFSTFVSKVMQAVLGAEEDRVQVLDIDWGPASEIPLAAVDPQMTLTQVTMPTPPLWGIWERRKQ